MRKFLMFGLFIMFLFRLSAQTNVDGLPSDCVNAITICGNGTFNSNADGYGAEWDLYGCGNLEHNSVWLKFDIVQDGNLGFILTPDNPSIDEDFDFWLFGPNVSCEEIKSKDAQGQANIDPLRCSMTNPGELNLTSNLTGMNSTSLATHSPPSSGNGWVREIGVQPGESYYLIIDRPYDGGGFSIEWTGTATRGTGAFPESPVANDIEDQVNCSNNGTAFFDLGQVVSDINSDPNNTVTFYHSLSDATDSINEVPSDQLYFSTAATTQIYAKVTNASGCYDVTEFNLLILPRPEASVEVNSLEICYGEESIFNFTGSPNAIVAYSINGAKPPYEEILLDETGSATLNMTFTEDTTIDMKYVTFAESNGCTRSIAETIEIKVNPNTIPTVNTNSPICEGEMGEMTFTGEANATIVYHIGSGASETITLDATGNFNLQFPDLMTTTEVTLESVTSAISPFCSLDLDNVVAIEVMTILELEDEYLVSECDTDGDGEYTFNLLDYESEILANADNPSDYVVTYHFTEQDALDNTGVIPNPNAFTATPNPQTVVGIRVSTAGSACVNTAALVLEITVLPDPSTTVLSPIVLCDEQTPNDSQEPFDLTQYETTIANGIANLTFSYHTSLADAESGDNAIPNVSNFVSGSSTVYVRVTSANAGTTECYAVFSFDLEVQPIPTIAEGSMTVCSPDVSGYYDFDLVAEIDTILGTGQNSSNFTVTFYEDATGNNQITVNPYTNTTEFNQTIYVEIVANETGCSEIFPYQLNVEAAAVANMPEPMIVCDYDGENDGYSTFDLTSLNAEVLNGQNPTDFSVSYYLSAEDAENGDNPIEDPAAYINTVAYGETIYIRVENNNIPDECYDTTSFEYTVAPLLNPEIYSQDGNNTICVDYETGEVLNSVTLESDLQDPNYAYTWYLNGTVIVGATQATYTVDTASPGQYTLSIEEIESETNCTSELSQEFEVFQSSQAVLVNVSQSGAFSSSPSIIVKVEGYGDYWFQLDDGPIVDNGGVFTNVSGGLHTVYVYDMKTETSCDPLVIENIRIIDYPKMFTPNNDGNNDVWNIFALDDHPEAEILIYDRYGKVLAQIKPSGAAWDGTFNGKPLPSTDYWFVLTYEELGVPKQFQAHFSIKR
ncbi:T9SS type B sorting domain-containing protein [Mangrovimonas sp. DI 80]|uniref:T9SS type B sorting domain-containing protein n=1 Tax=Mangrovimonas sp. DI 80 TaxID=1779330 RepID=UPI001558DECC|nr:T9SS type B sorting domain-containing protein [Mangrovimonas sp. DI 80]